MTTARTTKSRRVRQAGQDGLRVEVVEERVRLEACGVRPQRAEDLEEVRHEHERRA